MVWDDWLRFGIAVVAALAGALALGVAVTLSVRLAARRHRWAGELARRARRPFRVLLLLIAVWAAVGVAYPDADASGAAVGHVLGLAAIAVVAWMLIALDLFATDQMLGRYDIDVPDNRTARKLRTQT